MIIQYGYEFNFILNYFLEFAKVRLIKNIKFGIIFVVLWVGALSRPLESDIIYAIVDVFQELIKIYIHIVVPGLASITFLALAKFIRHITPLRALVSSEQTYISAFWGFLIFGIYLGLRPVQVLAGPHPWPLIISCIREFLLIAIIGPALTIALLSLCFGTDKINKKWIIFLFVISFLMAVIFCYANAHAIGGSKEIVKLGKMTAYDGLWYESNQVAVEKWMRLLFIIRLINPGFLMLIAGILVLYHAKHYPSFKKSLYDNMPKKLYVLSAAVFVYTIFLIAGSCIYGFRRVPDQWGIYHLGSLFAGMLEAFSLAMPVRNDVQVSEHKEEDF